MPEICRAESVRGAIQALDLSETESETEGKRSAKKAKANRIGDRPLAAETAKPQRQLALA